MTTAALSAVADLKVGDRLHLSYDPTYAPAEQDVVVVATPGPDEYRPGTWYVDVEDPSDRNPFSILDSEIAAGLLTVTVTP